MTLIYVNRRPDRTIAVAGNRRFAWMTRNGAENNRPRDAVTLGVRMRSHEKALDVVYRLRASRKDAGGSISADVLAGYAIYGSLKPFQIPAVESVGGIPKRISIARATDEATYKAAMQEFEDATKAEQDTKRRKRSQNVFHRAVRGIGEFFKRA